MSYQTLSCQEADLLVTAFQFGELETSARDAYEQHVSHCPDCLNAFFEFKRHAEASGSIPSLNKTKGSIWARYRVSNQSRQRSPAFVVLAIAAGVTVFLATSSLIGLRFEADSTTRQPIENGITDDSSATPLHGYPL